PRLESAQRLRRYSAPTPSIRSERSLQARSDAGGGVCGVRRGMRGAVVLDGATPLTRKSSRQLLVAAASMAVVSPACLLDASDKTFCVTPGDCLGGFVCVSNRCVTRDAGSGGAGDSDASDGSPDDRSSVSDAGGNEPSLPEQPMD